MNGEGEDRATENDFYLRTEFSIPVKSFLQITSASVQNISSITKSIPCIGTILT